MKYLHACAIPLLTIAFTPVLATDDPAHQEPPEHAAQKLQGNANLTLAASSHEAARAVQVEQWKLAVVDTLKASADNVPGGVSQNPGVKPSLDAGDRLADQAAKIAELLARRQAGAALGAEQSEALRELLKQHNHTREIRLDTLQLNWLDLPVFTMSDEQLRAAGYPCIGPDDAPPVTDAPGNAPAPGETKGTIADAMIRAALATPRMAALAALKHKEHHAASLAAGQPCDDCPDGGEGRCTETAHTGAKTKDFDCVGCPDQQVA